MRYLFLVLTLAACSALTPAKFDGIEMDYYAHLYQGLIHLEKNCIPARRSEKLYILVDELETVERLGYYLSEHGDETEKELVKNIKEQFDGFIVNGSETYCKQYTQNLESSVNRAMQTLGKRSK